MPRHSYKRIQPDLDPVYNSFEIAKLINYIMYDGKKTVAQEIVYKTMKHLQETEKDALGILHKAIVNATPEKEVRARRLGGASYLVPTEVRSSRRLHLALNWIVEGARSRSNKEFPKIKALLFQKNSKLKKQLSKTRLFHILNGK
jgi:small subunit ribosomal protein S7